MCRLRESASPLLLREQYKNCYVDPIAEVNKVFSFRQRQRLCIKHPPPAPHRILDEAQMSTHSDVTSFKNSAWQRQKKARSYAQRNGPRSGSSLQINTYVRWILEDCQPSGTKILDVGCGTGALTTPLSRAGFNVTGVDASQAMLNQIPRSRRVKTVVGNALSHRVGLDASEDEFDVAVSRWVLPHFPEWPQIIHNIASVLKVSGRMYVDFPNPNHYKFAEIVSGNTEAAHGYSFGDSADPSSYYRAPSQEEVAVAASSAGCELVEVRPASFLATNAMATSPNELSAWLDNQFGSTRSSRAISQIDEALINLFPVNCCGLLIYKIVRCR